MANELYGGGMSEDGGGDSEEMDEDTLKERIGKRLRMALESKDDAGIADAVTKLCEMAAESE